MSVIHKALSKSTKHTTVKHSASFNPLQRPTDKKRGKTLYLLLGLGFVLATIGLFLWPDPAKSFQQIAQTASPEATSATASLLDGPSPTKSTTTTSTDNTPIVETTSTTTTTEDSKTEPMQTEEVVASLSSSNPTDIQANAIGQEAIVSSTEKSEEELNTQTKKPTPATRTEPLSSNESKTATIAAKASIQKNAPAIQKPTSQAKTNTQTPIKASTSTVINQQTNRWQQNTARYIDSDEIEQAEAELKQWISATPNDVVPRIWLAKIYINNGFYQAAEPLINQSNDKDAKALLGVVYERTARPELAARLFEDLYRTYPSQGKWLLFWAINAENSGQVAKSLVLYQNYLQVFSLDDVKLSRFAEQRVNVLQGQ